MSNYFQVETQAPRKIKRPKMYIDAQKIVQVGEIARGKVNGNLKKDSP